MYGTFTWTVALPAAPADKDSLADISKIRQFWVDLINARIPGAKVLIVGTHVDEYINCSQGM